MRAIRTTLIGYSGCPRKPGEISPSHRGGFGGVWGPSADLCSSRMSCHGTGTTYSPASLDFRIGPLPRLHRQASESPGSQINVRVPLGQKTRAGPIPRR